MSQTPVFKPGNEVLLGETLAKGGVQMLEHLAFLNITAIPYLGAVVAIPVIGVVVKAALRWLFDGLELTAGRLGVKIHLKFEDPIQQAKVDAATGKIKELQTKPDATQEEIDAALKEFDDSIAAIGRRRRL